MNFFFLVHILNDYLSLRVVALFQFLCFYLANINLVRGRYFLMQAQRMGAEPGLEVQKKISK